MAKIILRRLLQLIPTLFVVVAFTCIATRLIPGDPVAAMVGDQYDVSKVEEMRASLGLDDPIIVQFWNYLVSICQGDFGTSYYFNQPAIDMIAQRLPNTLLISVIALIIAVIFGVVFGVVSARKQNSIVDYVLTVLSLFGVSAPVFWVGIMLVLLFSVTLGWLPSYGMGSIEKDGLIGFISHLVLPCFCLAIIPMGTFTRITRSSMIETLGSDSVRAMRARGVSETSITWKHALKNALPPIITVIAIQFAGCFAGAVLTENVFAWPGMGTMITSAIDNRDYSLIQATVLVVAIAFVVINLITDLLYMVINPKVAAEAKKGANNV